MASPSPAPPNSRVGSSCPPGRSSGRCLSQLVRWGCPRPSPGRRCGSRPRRAPAGAPPRTASTVHPAALGGELHRVGQQVHHHLPQLLPIRRPPRLRRLRQPRARAPAPCLLRLRLDAGDGRGCTSSLHVHRLEGEPHLARLDLRHVEDGGDQLEQRLALLHDGADVVDLLLVERAHQPLGQHLRVADDGRERRAQLVAHRGQEARLEPVQLLQLRRSSAPAACSAPRARGCSPAWPRCAAGWSGRSSARPRPAPPAPGAKCASTFATVRLGRAAHLRAGSSARCARSMPCVMSVSVGGRSFRSSGAKGPKTTRPSTSPSQSDRQHQVAQPGEAGHARSCPRELGSSRRRTPARARSGSPRSARPSPAATVCGAARAPLGEGEDVAAEVAVAALMSASWLPRSSKTLMPTLVELAEALHHLREGAGSPACRPAEPPLEHGLRPRAPAAESLRREAVTALSPRRSPRVLSAEASTVLQRRAVEVHAARRSARGTPPRSARCSAPARARSSSFR